MVSERIVENNRVLVIFDKPSYNGFIYSYKTAYDIKFLLIKNNIGGIILPENADGRYNEIKESDYEFKILNPNVIVENDDLTMTCDVEFNNEETYNKLKDKKWSLVICGFGKVENGIVENLEKLTAINIAIIPEEVYNKISKEIER